LLTPPAEAAASQKWKIIYLQVLSPDISRDFANFLISPSGVSSYTKSLT